jgi:hypothetical protein
VKLEHPVTGDSGFAEKFAASGPRDKRGRSLRDFDLKTRIFRYPLSYMVYSETFDALPAPARDRLLRKLYDRLKTAGQSDAIAVLADTKPGLPEYWR